MRVMVLHAHPLETSYNRALCNAVMETLQAKGHHADLVDHGQQLAQPSRQGVRTGLSSPDRSFQVGKRLQFGHVRVTLTVGSEQTPSIVFRGPHHGPRLRHRTYVRYWKLCAFSRSQRPRIEPSAVLVSAILSATCVWTSPRSPFRSRSIAARRSAISVSTAWADAALSPRRAST